MELKILAIQNNSLLNVNLKMKFQNNKIALIKVLIFPLPNNKVIYKLKKIKMLNY